MPKSIRTVPYTKKQFKTKKGPATPVSSTQPMLLGYDRGWMSQRDRNTAICRLKRRNWQATGLAPSASTMAGSCRRVLFQMGLDAFHRETRHSREKLAPEMCVDTPRPFCYSTRFALCAGSPGGSFPVRPGRELSRIRVKCHDLAAVCPGGTQAHAWGANLTKRILVAV